MNADLHAAAETLPRPLGEERNQSPLAQRVDALAASHRWGFCLPQPFYTDREIFDWDVERVFFRNWLLTGHISRIEQPGQYYLYEVGGESIIISRGSQGEVRAVFNVCRHRGSRVCDKPEGRANSLACPYHAWTYALDGRLLGAAAMPEGFDKSEYGLKACPVRVEHGLIFVFLGDGPPPEMDRVFAEVAPFLAPYQLERSRLAARMTWEIQANWKLVVENFAECYHCGPAHPEYCEAMQHTEADASRSAAQIKAFEQQTADWERHAASLGHFTGSIPASADYPHCASRMPIGYGRTSQSRTGEPLAPLMGTFRQSDGGYTSVRIHPAGYLLGPCDHMVVCRFTPLSVDRTLQEMLWLVHPDAVPGRDFDAKELTWLWDVTTEQDLKIIEDNQKGVSSRAYEPGPYSKSETTLSLTLRWYMRQVASNVD